MDQIKKCCLCGKEFKGWGNNPYGALNQKSEPIAWKDTDCCCDDCNINIVIPGRMILMYKTKTQSY